MEEPRTANGASGHADSMVVFPNHWLTAPTCARLHVDARNVDAKQSSVWPVFTVERISRAGAFSAGASHARQKHWPKQSSGPKLDGMSHGALPIAVQLMSCPIPSSSPPSPKHCPLQKRPIEPPPHMESVALFHSSWNGIGENS